MYIASVPFSRAFVERGVMFTLVAASTVAVLTTLGIILSLIVESIQFFRLVPITDFLFGLHWSPQMAIREDQVGASGAFGAIPLLVGTLLISERIVNSAIFRVEIRRVSYRFRFRRKIIVGILRNVLEAII